MVVAPSSALTTLNLPAMGRAASRILGSSSSASSFHSATAEMTDIRCDLPVP